MDPDDRSFSDARESPLSQNTVLISSRGNEGELKFGLLNKVLIFVEEISRLNSLHLHLTYWHHVGEHDGPSTVGEISKKKTKKRMY